MSWWINNSIKRYIKTTAKSLMQVNRPIFLYVYHSATGN